MPAACRTAYKLKCWLPGGASTDFLLPEHLKLAMDYDTIMKAGSRMGTGLLMVVDDKQNMVSVVRNLEEFFARESCGWCTPCRDGLPWTVKILRALERGKAQPGISSSLSKLTRALSARQDLLCPCALAPWNRCKVRSNISVPSLKKASGCGATRPNTGVKRNGHHSCRRQAVRSRRRDNLLQACLSLGWTSPIFAGTRRWAAWAPAASARSSSTPMPMTSAVAW
jgi:hypothetical protein